MTLFLILMQIWASNVQACRTLPETAHCQLADRNGVNRQKRVQFPTEALSLPSGKLQQSEGYHAYMDQLERERMKSVNEMTQLLNSLTDKSDVLITGKPAPPGYRYTGLSFRGMGIYSRVRRSS